MTKFEKGLVLGILIVVGLEVIRSFTWGPTTVIGKPFEPIGMSEYASVSRRA